MFFRKLVIEHVLWVRTLTSRILIPSSLGRADLTELAAERAQANINGFKWADEIARR